MSDKLIDERIATLKKRIRHDLSELVRLEPSAKFEFKIKLK